MSDKPSSLDQSRRFQEAARELECDETGERFKRALKKVAKKPPPEPKRSNDQTDDKGRQ